MARFAHLQRLRMSRGDADRLKRAHAALHAANFFLADVRDGLGPYLAIYLLTEQKWDEAHIGIVMSIATIAGIAAQTPAGALVDATKAKRLVSGAPGCFPRRHLPPCRSALSAIAPSRGGSDATKASITPAMPRRPLLQVS